MGLLLGTTTISLAVPKVMGNLIDSVMQGTGALAVSGTWGAGKVSTHICSSGMHVVSIKGTLLKYPQECGEYPRVGVSATCASDLELE